MSNTPHTAPSSSASEALQYLERYAPCTHEDADTTLGDGKTWAKCGSCGLTFEQARWSKFTEAETKFFDAVKEIRAALAQPAAQGVTAEPAPPSQAQYLAADLQRLPATLAQPSGGALSEARILEIYNDGACFDTVSFARAIEAEVLSTPAAAGGGVPDGVLLVDVATGVMEEWNLTAPLQSEDQLKGFCDDLRAAFDRAAPASSVPADRDAVPTWQERAKEAGEWPCFSGDAAAPFMAAEIADHRALKGKPAAPAASVGDALEQLREIVSDFRKAALESDMDEMLRQQQALFAEVRRLLAVPAAPLTVPQGMALVPIEPTGKMTAVGQSLRYESGHSIGAIYCAMLLAAPAVPASEPKGEQP